MGDFRNWYGTGFRWVEQKKIQPYFSEVFAKYFAGFTEANSSKKKAFDVLQRRI